MAALLGGESGVPIQTLHMFTQCLLATALLREVMEVHMPNSSTRSHLSWCFVWCDLHVCVSLCRHLSQHMFRPSMTKASYHHPLQTQHSHTSDEGRAGFDVQQVLVMDRHSTHVVQQLEVGDKADTRGVLCSLLLCRPGQVS